MTLGAVTSAKVLNRQFTLLARDALARGDLPLGRRLAREAIERSRVIDDLPHEADGLLLLGRTHVLDSELRLALDCASDATALFERLGDPGGRAAALSIVSYAGSSLGLPPAASGAGDLQGTLAEHRLDERLQTLGYNYLGISAFWSRDYDGAARYLGTASDHARASGDQGNGIQPLVNRCFLEVLKSADHERTWLAPPDPAPLVLAVRQAQGLVAVSPSPSRERPTADIGLFLLEFASCYAALRRHDTEQAERHYNACLGRIHRMSPRTWLQAVAWWAKAEVSRYHGKTRDALQAAYAMEKAARASEHLRLENIARSLRFELHAANAQARRH